MANYNKIELNRRLELIGESIIQYVKQDTLNYTENGLLSGNWGLVIFLFHYSRFKNDDSIYILSSKLAASLLEKIDNKNTYCDGLSGVLYALLHLKENKFIEVEPFEKEIIQRLKNKLLIEIDRKNYDYLHGYIGFGLLFIKCGINTREIVDALYNSAEIDPITHSFKWRDSTGNYNISLSHGMASIILFLVKVRNSGCGDLRCNEMIIGGCKFILSQIMNCKKSGSFFPSYSVSDKETNNYGNGSRLAWCYGDLGVAFALYKASELIGDLEMQKKASNILQKTTLRKELFDTQIVDACICHGTAGLAMFYRRLYLDTKINIFLDASSYWMSQTLGFSQFQDGIAGFKTKYVEEYKSNLSLLMGVAGIGIVLISFLEDNQQKWDEFFFLS